MKKIQLLLIVGSLFLLGSCSQKSKIGDFNLLPLPQEFDLTGASKLNSDNVEKYYALNGEIMPACGKQLERLVLTRQKEDAQVIFGIDTSINVPGEGYILDIARKQINIRGKDQAGLFYGFKTLEQLMQDAKEQEVFLPECHVKDFPLLPYRAIHLDVKHHIDEIDYYYNLIDKLAGYKLNAIIVELEDKLKYKRQPKVGSADALTIEQWKALSDYAIERNIEISPLVQGLGHASFILKHDKYRDLRDDPESDWAFNPLDSQTYKVQFDLYLDAMRATPHGNYLHVGGDEVHTTGRNSGKSALELQLIWLNKVSKFAEENGRTPIFWDDMPLKHANVYRPIYNTELSEQEITQIWTENEHRLIDFLSQFPKNCVYMRWNYSDPDTPGNIKAMEWFVEKGFHVMGATAGQTSWFLMPQNQSNIGNIKSFAEISIDSGFNGLLLTLWDDSSPHFELYTRGIIAFAEYTWTGSKRAKDKFKAAYRHREFSYELSDPQFAFIDQLEEAVAFWNTALLKGNNTTKLRKSLLSFQNPIEETIIDLPDNNKKGEWSKNYAARIEEAKSMLEICDTVAAKIKVMKNEAKRNKYTLQVYEQVNNLSRFAPQALLTLENYDKAAGTQQKTDALQAVKDLQNDFNHMRQEFEEVYKKTRRLNKPEGYDLGQRHHQHFANQTVSFDWQFMAELLFLEKIKMKY